MKTRTMVYGLLWLLFAAHGFGLLGLTPPDDPHSLPMIMKMIHGETTGINPLVVSLFNIMGILPLLHACFLIPADHGRKFPAGIVVTLMMGVGAFALLPYLALRSSDPVVLKTWPWWVKIFDSRWLALGLGVALLALLGLALGGDWAGFVKQWQHERFIHVMSLDFLMLSALLPVLMGEDLVRRGVEKEPLASLRFIPLLGPVLYLILRPALAR